MLTQKSFAKINLYLEVIGQNNNGYHLLDSLMAPIDIYDIISIEASPQLKLIITSNNKQDLSDQENIILKAFNLLDSEYKLFPKVSITLEKNIPIGGGLGGGSANAATTLLLLNQFYNLNLSATKLAELGLKLGSDVPFCLNHKIALVSGVGENINDIKINQPELWPELWLLIINPKKALATKAVYELFARKYYQPQPYLNKPIQPINHQTIIEVIKSKNNDLGAPAQEIMPEIVNLLNIIGKQDGCIISRMSGSGSTCFGIFQSTTDLDKAYQNLQKIFPDYYLKKSKVSY